MIPFFGAIGVVGHTIYKRNRYISEPPFYIKLSQMFKLSVLSVVALITDYAAIVSYSSMEEIKKSGLVGLDFRLPFFLIVKLTATPLFTHLFSTMILSRFYVPKIFFYVLIQVFGIFVYEFTVWDRNDQSTSYDISGTFISGFKFIIPKIYTYKFQSTDGKTPVAVF